MLLRSFFLTLLILPALVAFAQDDVMSPEEVKDSMKFKKVMLIPFNPDLYFSDADHELAEFNRTSIPKIRHLFRYGLDFDINVRIISRHETTRLLRDTSEDAQNDLRAIYEGLSYKYEKTSALAFNEKKSFKDRLSEKIKKNDETDDSEAVQKASKYKDPPKEANKFMNVVPHHPEMFSYLYEKYETDLFVFINQFELKTNYEECLDRANKIFQREVRVHYSIFDKDGDQLHGDVITVHFPSNSNDMDNIMRSNFPMISDVLAEKLPRPRKISQQ